MIDSLLFLYQYNYFVHIKNKSFFNWDKYCHLVPCLHLIDPNYYLQPFLPLESDAIKFDAEILFQITAPSSLLIWLVSVVAMIPAAILQLRSPQLTPADSSADTVTLLNFQVGHESVTGDYLATAPTIGLNKDIFRYRRDTILGFGVLSPKKVALI